jgi:hypothetical protein
MNAAIQYQDIVSALYRAILRREPDSQGLQFYTGRLEANGPNEIPAIIDSLVSSPEHAAKNPSELIELSNTLKRIINFVGDEIYVSLGTHCYASNLLKRGGKKQKSHPFDWIFSNPEMVAHCLETDFEIFLDRQFYLPVPESQRLHGKEANLCQHTYYRDNYRVQFVFNHHDPTQDEDYSYITRCVERFRLDQQSDAEKKYIMFTRRCPEAVFHRLLAALPSARARLLCVLVDDSKKTFGWNEKLQAGSSRLIEYHSKSAWGALEFADPFDDLLLAKLIIDHY